MAQLGSKGFPLRVFPVSCLYELLQLKQARYMNACENGDMANFIILIQHKGVAMPVSFVHGSISTGESTMPQTRSISALMELIAFAMRARGHSMSDKAARAIALSSITANIGRYAAWQHATKHGILREYRIARQLAAAAD